jgi:mono/diheme cytochrome c family protein
VSFAATLRAFHERPMLAPLRVHPLMKQAVAPACLITLATLACAPTRSVASQWRVARDAVPSGARIYDRECASCHGKSGEGTRGIPALVGAGALPMARENRPTFKTARDSYDYISTTMPLPQRTVGTLSSGEYWLLVELLLLARGVDLPSAVLSLENAGSVEFE